MQHAHIQAWQVICFRTVNPWDGYDKLLACVVAKDICGKHSKNTLSQSLFGYENAKIALAAAVDMETALSGSWRQQKCHHVMTI